MPIEGAQPGEEWKGLGDRTMGCVVDGRIYAILFWSDGFAAGLGDEPLWGSGEGWFFVFTEDPDAVIKITGGPIEQLSPGASDQEFWDALRPAVRVAKGWIRERLGIA